MKRNFSNNSDLDLSGPESAGNAEARRKDAALMELRRVIQALDADETPKTDIALRDEYHEFGLDKLAAHNYAELFIDGAEAKHLKRVADALPFGERQLHEALVNVLVDRLERQSDRIDWMSIGGEDASVFSDERVQRAVAAHINKIVEANRDGFDLRSKYNPFIRIKRRSRLQDQIAGILNFVPSAANEVFLKMTDDGLAEEVLSMIEHINPMYFHGRLNAELASKLQEVNRDFLGERQLEFFSGLTKENLANCKDSAAALRYVSSFAPEVQKWVAVRYLHSTEGNDEWNLGGFILDNQLMDRTVLAAMRLYDLEIDPSWAASLPPAGEGVDALLEVLDDPRVPETQKQSMEFRHEMYMRVLAALRDGIPVRPDVVRAAAFARQTHKVSPGTLFELVRFDSSFLDGPADDNRTGPAVVAMHRRSADAEKQEAGGSLAEWGAVDTESPLIAGNTSSQIADRIERFGTAFGWTSALRFANRVGFDDHDAYLCVDLLERFSQMRPELARKDFALLLDQVVRDDAKYDGNVSQVEFRFVLDKIGDATVEDVFARVAKLNLPSLAERVSKLRDDPRFHPYKTWKGMKEFAAVVDYLNKNKALERLADSDAPESTKTFGHALLGHPTVPGNEVLKFLTDPVAFLSAAGSYTSGDAQSRMAPINLVRVERLGLSASEVRDAIADGSLDHLQVLPAFERTFTFDAHGADPFSADALQRTLLFALGRRERLAEDAPEGGAVAIAGKARNAKKLFAAVNAAFDRHGIARENRRPWLLGEAMMVPSYWTEALARDLYAAAHDKNIGIDAAPTFEVRARIGKKSDPSLIVAGNDTASCMPFGDGKTNVYAWSPACAQMVVERRLADGSWRTMAQSVVMPTLVGDEPAPGRFAQLLSNEKVHGVLNVAEFARPTVVLCDNVEPNQNDVQEGRMPVIEAAYRGFFRDYLSRYAETIGADPTRVVVGKEEYLQGHDRLSFPKIQNVFVPLAPISYTDNNEAESFVIETGLKSLGTPPSAGIRDVTGADILAMAYMEGKGFADNEGMMFGLYDRQQRVTAALISREQHGDPGLTLMARDDKGEPVGYMLAYVGHEHDVPEAFIDDFAVDRSKNLVAARHASRLLDAFLDRYVTHYESRGEPFPSVFAQMREDTSYKLLLNQLEKLSSRRHIRVEIVEEGIGSLGGEPMHHVRLFIGKTDADIAAARARWKGRIRKPEEGTPVASWDEGDEPAEEETDWQEEDQW